VPTLLIAVMDNSGSVAGPQGSDPISNRYSEMEHAFSVVARRGSSKELGAILHFDTPTSGDVAPTPLTRGNLARLQAGLHPPADGAGTSNLSPSLARATELAKKYPEHEVTLVLDPVFTHLGNIVSVTMHVTVVGGI
jgi:hypothetical protein